VKPVEVDQIFINKSAPELAIMSLGKGSKAYNALACCVYVKLSFQELGQVGDQIFTKNNMVTIKISFTAII
jgi:hypothetical protein